MAAQSRSVRRSGVAVVALLACLASALALPSASVDALSAKLRWRTTDSGAYVVKRLSNPARSVVYSSTGVRIATFTDGARTVTMLGPVRTFAEPSTTAAVVRIDLYVRLLDRPFTGVIDSAWLAWQLQNNEPDVISAAMQYVAEAPAVFNDEGLQIAGDADYGPIGTDGTREAGSDFNDYLGVDWTYPSGYWDAAEPLQFRSLDCSGYVRMVFGYRSGLPLGISPTGGASVPRRSFEIESSAPGVFVIANNGGIPSTRFALLPGDLVFFDASTSDGTQIDHVGIYLGKDSLGHDRFVSSRKTANGPTMGDVGGYSRLDGTGLYARSFRSARRL